MNVKLKPRQRVNGDVNRPKWETDDEADMALANKLADAAADAPDEIPTLPPMAPPAKPGPQPPAKPAVKPPQVTPVQPSKPKDTINVLELIEALLAAYTAPDVHMWVQDNELAFEQVVKTSEGLFKNQWRLKIASFTTSSVKLIK